MRVANGMRHFLTFRAFIVIIAIAVLVVPLPSFAVDPPVNGTVGLINPIGGTQEDPAGTSDIPTILGTLLRSAFGLLGSLALAMFIYGGFLWLTSGGAADRIEKGKNTMVWAILGIAVAFTAYAIVDFVIGTITKK